MNDRPASSFSDDDLSAAIDGELDDAVVARIDADPAARDRMAELARARSLVGRATVAPLDDDTIDDLIVSALDAPVAPARPGRATSYRGPSPWLVAAAIVLLVAVGLTLVWNGHNQGDTASQSTASGQSSADAAELSPKSGGADQQSSTTGSANLDSSSKTLSSSRSSGSEPLLYLGSFDDGAALRKSVAKALPPTSFQGNVTTEVGGKASTTANPNADTGTASGGASRAPSAAVFDRCDKQLQVTLSMKKPATKHAYASVDDKTVLVYEFETTSSTDKKTATTLVAAVGADACEPVVIFER